MSLVERALKKIQESRGAVPPRLELPLQAHVQPAPIPAPHPVAGVEGVASLVLEQSTPSHSSLHTVTIDRTALRSATILPPEHQERQLADEYRQIKRPLLANALGRGVPALNNGRLIMVGSALPGDGKTFTCISLALSMALDRDISIVLVDGDVAKPHISEIFGLQREKGLLDVLRDEALNVESVILPTDLRGLSILPAGRHSDTAAELMSGGRMEQVVKALSGDPKRIVVFDSPPLLLTSEARALAGAVGQVVLVVKAGTTSQQAVLEAIDLLGEGKSVGLLLNQSDEQSRAGYYQYYGQRDEKTEATAD